VSDLSTRERRIAMQTYPIPMVPGPVSMPPEVLKQYQINYSSGDLETDFLELYNRGRLPGFPILPFGQPKRWGIKIS
jgi:hypothetical protein